jgi:hypothetical protein
VPGDETADVPIVVELQRDVTLRVEVVDDGGRPCAGLFVQVESQFVSRRRGSGTYGDQFGPTDGQGRATWLHVQRRTPVPGPDVLAFAMNVSCALRHLESKQRAVLADELMAAAPVRLVVPSGGEVVVLVVDADGKPYVHTWPVLRCVGEDITCSPSGNGGDGCRFAQVPVARRWLAELRISDNPPAVAFDGPRQAGDLVKVALQVPRRQWLLRGRLLQDGAPLIGAVVRLQRTPDADSTPDRSRRTTDERGCFALFGTLGDEVAACDVSLLVEHGCVPKDTCIACSKQLAPGEVDAGDIELPPFAANRALATVQVLGDGRDISATAGAGLSVRDAEQPTHGKPWLTQVRQTDRGIELWGPVPPGELELFVSANGYLGKRVSVRLHEQVTVELERAAELWASLVPPIVPLDILNVTLAAEGIAAGHGRGPTEQRSNQWNWPFQGPGHYRIAVEIGDTVVYESEPFELQPGMNRWPSDGSVRDLRHTARMAHLDVVDADTGVRVDEPLLYAVRRLQTDEGDVEDAEDAGEWFLVRANAPDVLVAAAGYQPLRIPGPTSDQRVGLRRMTTVRLFAVPRASETIVRIVEDGVRDRLLRDVDSHPHGPEQTVADEPMHDFMFARETVLEFVAVIDGVRQPAQRVVVGAISPQEVHLR